MNDNDIIKALEEMVEYPHYYEEGQRLKSVLDLINRQKAEIDELQLRVKLARDFLDVLREGQNEIYQMAMIAKSEAIKEFAERLKEKGAPVTGGKGFEGVFVMCSNLVIDNLVKEMVGDTE